MQCTESIDHEGEQEDGKESDTVKQTPTSLIEANKAIMIALRNFTLSIDKSGPKEKEFWRSLSSMEDTALRMATKTQKQPSPAKQAYFGARSMNCFHE